MPRRDSYPPPPARVAFSPGAQMLRLPERLVIVVAGGLLLALLLTAAWLTPSPRGMGTHQQLGLPPCTLVQFLGIRCPSCGMTTSWAHLVRGHAWAAFRANAGGALLGVAAVVCGPWLVVSGIRGRWCGGPPNEWLTLLVGFTIMGVTLIDWAVRLSLGW